MRALRLRSVDIPYGAPSTYVHVSVLHSTSMAKHPYHATAPSTLPKAEE